MRESPPTLPTVYLTISPLQENIASLSKTEEVLQDVNLSDASPFLANDILRHCASSQLAEGRCSIVAFDTSSLESKAVEEYDAIPLPVNSASPDLPLYLTMGVLGTVTLGLVALVSLVALVLGRDISLKAAANPTTRSVEFTTNHQEAVK